MSSLFIPCLNQSQTTNSPTRFLHYKHRKDELKLKDSFLSSTEKFLVDRMMENDQDVKHFSPTDDMADNLNEEDDDEAQNS